MIHNVKMGLLNPYSLTHSLLILGGLIKYKKTTNFICLLRSIGMSASQTNRLYSDTDLQIALVFDSMSSDFANLTSLSYS